MLMLLLMLLLLNPKSHKKDNVEYKLFTSFRIWKV